MRQFRIDPGDVEADENGEEDHHLCKVGARKHETLDEGEGFLTTAIHRPPSQCDSELGRARSTSWRVFAMYGATMTFAYTAKASTKPSHSAERRS